ncbi:MAG: hypothetical protein K6B71_01100 [Alphaproteobacteria bacterium]|nr:hypothetical protein [Alphaproteobacteria bacterium]
MHNLLKIFGKTIGYMSVFAFVCSGAVAENVRSAAAGARNPNDTRGRGTSNANRMVSIPIMPLGVPGNVSTGKPVNYVSDNAGSNSGITPADPTDDNGNNNNGNNGNNGNNDDNGNNNGGNTTPSVVCDLSYNVDSCMADIYACVNNGGLPNGIRSMFDENMRYSIISGMNLCQSQVDYCITNVVLPQNDGQGCVHVYGSAADVWYDFNARRVQPEYYNYVLRRTGLTPEQAQGICALLDRNTYGASFNAVSGDIVTSEYNKGVDSYNGGVGDDGRKQNPMGPDANTNGALDSDRGYYARWDAQNAQCLVRVAAYNKDKLISNEILWGVGGDSSPAEVWKSTGETFTCNKDLFGFALRRQTGNVAILAVPTLTAAGVGIAAGIDNKKNSDKKQNDDKICKDADLRIKITERLRQDDRELYALRQFLKDHELYKQGEGQEGNGGGTGANSGGGQEGNGGGAGDNSSDQNKLQANRKGGNLFGAGPIISEATCKDILTLYEQYGDSRIGLRNCEDRARQYEVDINNQNIQKLIANNKLSCEPTENREKVCNAFKALTLTEQQSIKNIDDLISKLKFDDDEDLKNEVKETFWINDRTNQLVKMCDCKEGDKLPSQDALDALQACRFKNMNRFLQSGEAAYCDAVDGECIGYTEHKRNVGQLAPGLNKIKDLLSDTRAVTKEQKAKDMAVGGAIGAAAGGTATLIAAFVEGSRINCRVGDDLARVDLNKSYTIDTLRDFYVKWAIPKSQVENYARSAEVVTNCGNWEAICNLKSGEGVDACKAVTVNYLPNGVYTPMLVESACEYNSAYPAANRCTINLNKARQYGIVGRDESCPEPGQGGTNGVDTNVADANAANAATR